MNSFFVVLVLENKSKSSISTRILFAETSIFEM